MSSTFPSLAAPDALLLGTAMWAWTIPKAQCFALLDTFYELGGRTVDTATNYPINKIPEDFRAAESILAEWIRTHKVNDLKVMVKIGSVNNMMTPDHLLSPSFLQLSHQNYRALFGSNFHTLMIHWDNRGVEGEILETLSVLDQWRKAGLVIGLSGIRHPQAYAKVLTQLAWSDIPLQLKHNLIYSDFERYAPLHALVQPITYGITGGGLKLNAKTKGSSLKARGRAQEKHSELLEQVRSWLANWSHPFPIPSSMNQLGMLYACYHPGIDRLLLGASRPSHIQDSFAWYDTLDAHDYHPVYHELVQIAHATAV